MKKMTVLFLVFILIAIGCTTNPIANDTKMNDQSIIRGQIEIRNKTVHNNIFIWLEGSNVTTVTDENGTFEIQIPPPSQQTGGGLNGIFNLYFYLANYALDSASVLLRNGNLVRDNGDIDSEGVLRKNISLFKVLNISITFNPNPIATGYNDRIIGTVALHTTTSIPVEIVIPKMVTYYDPPVVEDFLSQTKLNKAQHFWKEIITSTILYNAENERTELIKHPTLSKDAFQKYWTISEQEQIFEVWIEWPPFTNSGILEVTADDSFRLYPYFFVSTQNLPSGLVEQIGENVYSFSPDFINYPIKENYGSIRIQ